ncbi:MAG: DUF4174 domain-containing protein [Bacteroidota bacterium]
MQKSLFFLSFFLLSFFSMQAQLTQHQWKNRILLLFAEHPDDSLLIQQIAHFEEDTAGLEDRDLIIYKICKEEGVAPNGKELDARAIKRLRDKYKVSNNSFTVILIGKDGGEKLRRKGKLLTRKALYRTIDAMPMRRAEMRRKN